MNTPDTFRDAMAAVIGPQVQDFTEPIEPVYDDDVRCAAIAVLASDEMQAIRSVLREIAGDCTSDLQMCLEFHHGLPESVVAWVLEDPT